MSPTPYEFTPEDHDLPEGDKLERLSGLIHRFLELERELVTLGQQSETARKEAQRVSEIDLPELLAEVGLSELTNDEGYVVELKEAVRVSTTGKHREAIFAWLGASGHGDVIKEEVVVSFAAGEGALAEELMGHDLVSPRGTRKRSVNPQTFAALVRELLADGIEVPIGELGIFIQKWAKVTAPKGS